MKTSTCVLLVVVRTDFEEEQSPASVHSAAIAYRAHGGRVVDVTTESLDARTNCVLVSSTVTVTTSRLICNVPEQRVSVVVTTVGNERPAQAKVTSKSVCVDVVKLAKASVFIRTSSVTGKRKPTD